MKMEHYDVIIIGSGLGGGTLAYRLAPSGKKILLLEQGGYLPREKENWLSEAVFVKGRYKAKESWLDKNDKIFHPGIHYFVGGNSKVYGAALFRNREKDFEEFHHHDGISPAWPVRYDDFAPYYLEAEKLYHVHGLRGSDPTEPPCSDPYPYPPVIHEPRVQTLNDDLEKVGCHPFHLPLGLILNEQHRERSKCIKCNTCDGFPCLVDAKADAHIVSVLPALKYPNVTLLTHTTVEKLETNGSGSEVKSVMAKSHGEPKTFTGNIIVVSCGAINSAALLLRSANKHHPNGLANSSDQVGRHYMCHNNSAAAVISPTPNPTTFEKTLAVNDYYFGSDDWDYPLGHIQMLGKSDGNMFSGDAPSFVPLAFLNKMAKYSLDFWLTTEDLPDPNNRVTLNSKGVIKVSYTENNLEAHRRLTLKLKELITKIQSKKSSIRNFLFLSKKIPLEGTAHQCGTLRFGLDPKTSVLDIYCKAHDLDNLYVVDGSFFVTSSSVNPGLTIIANALRVGDHLLNRLKK